MPEGELSAWAAATYAGATKATRDAVSAAPAEERLLWLDEALKLAELSGALHVARRDKRERYVAAWERTTPRTAP